MVAWAARRVSIAIVANTSPDFGEPAVIIGGLMSRSRYALAPIVKCLLTEESIPHGT
ncbi:hypothetical protein ACQP2U_38670 [Nocardia sp. CA-084685]|uniref:hypothetical protein n=1 Tax=Nocardia sp. CA-084685 TaxID=3239970 RepID=UPI003D99CB2B